jgi:hypothetical protein
MNSALPPIAIEAIAFWAQRLPSWNIARAVIRGEQAAPETVMSRPAPTLLAPTERRRAPDTVAVALEVAARACEAAGRSPTELPSVFASTHGDIAISDYLCATLATTPALVSPIKFHNSVHNAPAGYWSIGTGSLAPYTAISAYQHTFGAGLLEAATQVICEGKSVLYVAVDIEAKGPLGSMATSRGLLGVALVLGPHAGARHRRLALRVETANAVEPSRSRSAAGPLIADNALAPCLPMFEALASADPSTVRLALGERATLHAQVSDP